MKEQQPKKFIISRTRYHFIEVIALSEEEAIEKAYDHEYDDLDWKRNTTDDFEIVG